MDWIDPTFGIILFYEYDQKGYFLFSKRGMYLDGEDFKRIYIVENKCISFSSITLQMLSTILWTF